MKLRAPIVGIHEHQTTASTNNASRSTKQVMTSQAGVQNTDIHIAACFQVPYMYIQAMLIWRWPKRCCALGISVCMLSIK